VGSSSGLCEQRDAFRTFATRVSPALMRSALVLTGDRGHAEDLLQATLWRTARRWSSINGSPEAYAQRVLINLSRDRRRGLSRRVSELSRVDPPAGVVEDQVARLAERDWMVQAIRRLPARQREVLVLRFLLDLSVEQTARVLGTSHGTVKSHTSRALNQMRELLADPPATSDQPGRVRDGHR
jgi:RNA polymerase sigma-70 factor (sigma-E family)